MHAVSGAWFLGLGIPWLIYSHVVAFIDPSTPMQTSSWFLTSLLIAGLVNALSAIPMSRFSSNKMFDLSDLKANGFTFGGTGLTCMCLWIAWWFSGDYPMWLHTFDIPIYLLWGMVCVGTTANWEYMLQQNFEANERAGRKFAKVPKEEMQQKCDRPEVRKSIYIPQKVWGGARTLTVVGLVGWGSLTGLHDVMMLLECSELQTLKVRWLSTVSLGLAAASMFLWAMGLAGVYVAPIAEKGVSTCACFYQIPDLDALVALSTPLALFAVFFGRVQMQGLAALFGDYLSYQTYTIPHYLGRQSFLWTWAMLCSPKMVGTIQGDKRETFSVSQWKTLSSMQKSLYYFSLSLQAFVALSASSFMIRSKELLTSLYLQGDMTPSVNAVIKYILLPLPSAITVGVGLYAAWELYTMTLGTDGRETFSHALRTLLPSRMHVCVPDENTACEQILAIGTLIVGWVLLLSWTCAVAQGLCPDRDLLLGKKDIHPPRLAQAELWGACGFIFFAVHVPRITAIAFSTWDDMESLKYLANPEERHTVGKG